MMLVFRGALLSYSDEVRLWVQPADADDQRQEVRLVPGLTVVYEAADRAEADRFVAEAGRAIKRGLSCGAEWIDFSRLPEYVEVGTVTLRGCGE